VTVGGSDVDLVPRQVGVPEHHKVGGREPSPQTGGPAGGRARVVEDGHGAPVHRNNRALG
jgi:hypothetical protein